MNASSLPIADTPAPAAHPVISPAEARSVADRRLASAAWWWNAAAMCADENERDMIRPILALVNFTFSIATDTRDSARVREQWTWLHRETDGAEQGDSSQPLLVAVSPAVARERFSWTKYRSLLLALEADAGPKRYETWSDVESAVLAVAIPLRDVLLCAGGHVAELTIETRRQLDRLIAAVLVTGRLRDLRDQFTNRDRLVTPRKDWPVDEFEDRLQTSALQGYGVDRAILDESRLAVRKVIERLWPWYEGAEHLPDSFTGTARAWCWLGLHGGVQLLRRIELWNAETALHRPELTVFTRMMLRRTARRLARASAGTK